ncbi:integrase core domain protein [Pleomorphomonas sp. SM30]|nr:integrase core domain protein [Pleomorphomonas sp. SM30]GLS74779.1 hypothetical protein GCM10007904_01140 [Oharaeibacter diazotrophicus]
MAQAITEKGYSQRRACGLVGLEPKTYRYASKRPDDGALRERLKGLARERRRFGYRRLLILLRREGIELNQKKLFRLYKEGRLTVRRRGSRKRALGTRAPTALPQGQNQRWSLDFVSDVLADGRRFRALVVVDDFTRECLALVVDSSLSGLRVVRELDRPIEASGHPIVVVSNNSARLTSQTDLAWQQDNGVEWHSIRAARHDRVPNLVQEGRDRRQILAIDEPGEDQPTEAEDQGEQPRNAKPFRLVLEDGRE